jgi:hypothetical protein
VLSTFGRGFVAVCKARKPTLNVTQESPFVVNTRGVISKDVLRTRLFSLDVEFLFGNIFTYMVSRKSGDS